MLGIINQVQFQLLFESRKGVHEVRHAILGQFWLPPLVTHCHTSRDPPSVRHTYRNPPIFSSKCIHTYVFTGRFVLVREGSCLGGFCPGVPLPPVTNCHLLGPPRPLSVTYFMDGP